MEHLPAKLGFLVVLFASCRVGFSLNETWRNCSTNACKTFFQSRTCAIDSSCQCGVSTNLSSLTCGIDPSVISNATGVTLEINQGQLNCCMCESNSTFCCNPCQLTATPPTAAAATTATAHTTTGISQTTVLPVVQEAIVVVVFIVDVSKYQSRSKQLSPWFRYAISNLTGTDNSLIDVTNVAFYKGIRPNCGFQVESYVTTSSVEIGSNSELCGSMIINATLKRDSGSSLTAFENTTKIIQDSVKNGKFFVTLSDGSRIKGCFILSVFFNSSYVLHRGPCEFVESPTVAPTKNESVIHTNIWPLIYSAIGAFSLIALCIIWQCAKQTYLLRKKKYTDINSNRVNTRKKKIQEAISSQEKAEEPKRERGQFDMTHSKIQLVDNEALTRRYDWTTPSYLPNMLAPAYTPTELHGQRSPPRLMLDDDDSDSDKKSFGKASVINVDEDTDEDLKEILESEDEDNVFKERTSTRQSYVSRKKSVSTSNKRKPSTTSKSSKHRSSSGNTSAKSTSKIPNPAIGQIRKCSYSGPEGRERTPSLGFGNLKSNRVTPVDGDRRPSVSSVKPKKKSSSDC